MQTGSQPEPNTPMVDIQYVDFVPDHQVLLCIVGFPGGCDSFIQHVKRKQPTCPQITVGRSLRSDSSEHAPLSAGLNHGERPG